MNSYANNAYLQQLVTPKRCAEKPSMPWTSTGERSMDAAGVLYVLDDPPTPPESPTRGKDYYKYRVVDEDDENLEEQRRQKMIATIQRRQAAIRQPVMSAKYIPPQFGMASKTQKIDKKNFDKSLTGSANVNGKNSAMNLTIQELKSNTLAKTGSDFARTEPRNSKAATTVRPKSANNSFDKSKAERMKPSTGAYSSAISTNDSSRPRSSSNVRENEDINIASMMANGSTIDDISGLIKSKYFENIEVVDQLFREKQEMEQRLRQLELQLSNDGRLSASGAAALFEQMESVGPLALPKRDSDYDNDDYSNDADRSKNKSRAQPLRSQSAGRSRSLQRGSHDGSISRRSTSAPKFQLSINLQASIDRYEHKQIMLKEREEIKRKEDLAYEVELQERFVKAHGPHTTRRPSKYDLNVDHTGIFEAAKRARKRKEDILKKQQEEEEQKHKSNDISHLHDPPEKEPRGTDAAKRRADLVQQRLKLEKENEMLATLKMSQKLPEKDDAQLSAAQMREISERKKKKRMEEKQEKEESLRREKAAEELKRIEKIKNAPVPEKARQGTVASDKRAAMVKEKFDREVEEKRRQKALDAKKARLGKETAAVVRTIIEQREYTRKITSNYVDLKTICEVKTAEKRQELSLRKTEIKKRLEEKMKSRPSLIERFEKDVAKTQAHISAVNKIAANVIPAKDEFDELFDFKEKLLVSKK